MVFGQNPSISISPKRNIIIGKGISRGAEWCNLTPKHDYSKYLNGVRVYWGMLVHELLEIVVQKLKHKKELPVAVEHFMEAVSEGGRGGEGRGGEGRGGEGREGRA